MTKTDDQRSKRLAEALRENLRRRKAQAREAAGASAQVPATRSPSRKTDESDD